MTLFEMIEKYYQSRGIVLFSVPVNGYERVLQSREKLAPLMLKVECLQLANAVRSVEKVEGIFIEVGCYKGGSAKIICEEKGDREFHVFDTFEGIKDAKPGEKDQNGDYVASEEAVRKLLEPYPNVQIHKGRFPDSASPIRGEHIAFANIDIDTYVSTRDCLRFILPRLSKGGVLVSHDYGFECVKRAFKDEVPRGSFLFPLLGSQVMLVGGLHGPGPGGPEGYTDRHPPAPRLCGEKVKTCLK
jgi:hypothetical protein